MGISFAEITAALQASVITDELDDYGVVPALFKDTIQPSDFTGSGINYYMTGNYDATIEYDDYDFIVNCRASTFAKSISLANVVITELNRKHYSGYFTTCSALPTISPADTTDNYNTIVQVNLKKY